MSKRVRAHDPKDDREPRKRVATAAAISDPSRLTFHVPTSSTVFSLGEASDASWNGWTGTFRGIAAATTGDLWMASSGAALIAGYAGSRMSAARVDKARHNADTWLHVGTFATGALSLVDTALFGAMSWESGLLLAARLAKTGFAVSRAVGQKADSDGTLNPGVVHVHGAQQVLTTASEGVTSAAPQNHVIGGLSAEMVGGVSASVKGLMSASLSGYMSTKVMSGVKTKVISRGSVYVAAGAEGVVKLAGKTIEVGSSASERGWSPKPPVTDTIEAAAQKLRMRAGDDGRVNVAMDAASAEVVVAAGSSSLTVEDGKQWAFASGNALRMDQSGLYLMRIAEADTSGALAAAEAKYQAALEAAGAAYESAANLCEGAAFAGLGAIVGTGGVLAHGLGTGEESLPALAGGAAAGALGGTAVSASVALSTAVATWRAAVAAARTVRDAEIAAARGVAPKLATARAAVTGTAPRISLKDDKVTVGIGSATIEVEGSRIRVDAGAAGTVQLEAYGRKVTMDANGIMIDAGADATKSVTLKGAGKTMRLDQTGWHSPGIDDLTA